MASGHGKDFAFKVDNENGTLTELTAYLTSCSFTRNGETADVTTMGDASREFIRGLMDATVDIEGIWDPTPDNLLVNVVDAGTLSIEVYPQGTASGKVKYTGDALCTSYNIPGNLDGAVTFSASFQWSGAVTAGTV